MYRREKEEENQYIHIAFGFSFGLHIDNTVDLCSYTLWGECETKIQNKKRYGKCLYRSRICCSKM